MVAVGFNPRTMSLQPWVRRVATIEIMANTCTSLHYHIVFSTKNRERWIRMGVRGIAFEPVLAASPNRIYGADFRIAP